MKSLHRTYQRGGALGSFLLLIGGVVIGLALSAIIYRSGQAQSQTPVMTENGFLEARPVVNTSLGGRVDTSTQSSIVNAVQKVGEAVVNIDVMFRATDDEEIPPFFRDLIPRDQRPDLRQGEGSGIIINGQRGLVLTNFHVVRDANQIDVRLKDGRRFRGQVIGKDPFSDIALVKIPAENLPTAVLGTAKNLPVGSWAIAIGNPRGYQHSVTVGVISAQGRDLPAPNGLPLEDLLQTDAAINPGNSGGALCDINGNVIGMNTAIDPGAQGIGFAVSVETVKYVVNELLENGRVDRAWMGVSFITLEEEAARKSGIKYTPGVILVTVRPDQPAGKAGLRPRDIITAVEGKPVHEADMVRDMVRRRKPGDKIRFLISRNGKAMTFTVTLGKMPDVEELLRQR